MSEELKELEVVEEQPKKRGRPKKVEKEEISETPEETEVVKTEDDKISEEEKKKQFELFMKFQQAQVRENNKMMYRYFSHWASSYSGSKKLSKRKHKLERQFA